MSKTYSAPSNDGICLIQETRAHEQRHAAYLRDELDMASEFKWQDTENHSIQRLRENQQFTRFLWQREAKLRGLIP